MQEVEISGLKQVIRALDAAPAVIRQARGEVFEEIGGELLADVRKRIGGSGRIAGVQEYYVGSGKGYAAVRAKAKTYVEGYAAGYVTNSLENGHKQEPGRFIPAIKAKLRRDRVNGKYMYRDTAERELKQAADAAAKRIEEAAVRVLNGGSA